MKSIHRAPSKRWLAVRGLVLKPVLYLTANESGLAALQAFVASANPSSMVLEGLQLQPDLVLDLGGIQHAVLGDEQAPQCSCSSVGTRATALTSITIRFERQHLGALDVLRASASSLRRLCFEQASSGAAYRPFTSATIACLATTALPALRELTVRCEDASFAVALIKSLPPLVCGMLTKLHVIGGARQGAATETFDAAMPYLPQLRDLALVLDIALAELLCMLNHCPLLSTLELRAHPETVLAAQGPLGPVLQHLKLSGTIAGVESLAPYLAAHTRLTSIDVDAYRGQLSTLPAVVASRITSFFSSSHAVSLSVHQPCAAESPIADLHNVSDAPASD